VRSAHHNAPSTTQPKRANLLPTVRRRTSFLVQLECDLLLELLDESLDLLDPLVLDYFRLQGACKRERERREKKEREERKRERGEK
jgi:hypothetical protein